MKTYSLKDLKTSVLPLCHGYEEPTESIKTTLGNTLIFTYNDRVWLLTCRHLVENVWRDSMIKSVMKSERANYFMMWKQKSHLGFHPSDSERQTLDLALYYFSTTESFDQPNKMWEWDSHYADNKLEERDRLKVLGIRSELMSPESIASSKPIQMEEIEGQYLKNTLDVSPEDYNRKLVGQQLVRVDKESLMELAGGLVAVPSENGWVPRGLITGSGTVTLRMDPDAPPRETGIFTYTDFSHLHQMLQTAAN